MGFVFGLFVGSVGVVALAVYAPAALLIPAGILQTVVDFVAGFFKKDNV